MRVVYIEWIDSAEASHGWEAPPNDVHDREIACISVGFVVKETRRHIWISTTADTANSNWLSAVKIWKKAIRSLEEVTWDD